jgi:hypothetical protein
MATKRTLRTWLDVVKAIAPDIRDDALPFCPACEQQRVHYLYIGDAATRVGYLVIWCNACLRGTRISRTIAPIGVHFITFTEADSTIAERVPNFTEVPPT